MPAPKGNQHAKGNRGGGRPTLYSPRYPKIVQGLCELGATDREIADKLDISVSTLNSWRATHVEFSDALTVGKEKADERVARALFNRAVGYSFDSEKVFHANGVITRAATVEHVPPDPKAAMDWLKNRRKGEWSDRSESSLDIRATIVSTRKIDISGLSEDQLDILEGALAQTLLTIEHDPTPETERS